VKNEFTFFFTVNILYSILLLFILLGVDAVSEIKHELQEYTLSVIMIRLIVNGFTILAF